MNLAAARASIARNKVPIAVAGVLAVIVLALRSRSTGGSAAAPTSSASSTSPLSKYPAFYTAGNGSYDSTGTDVYNALQDQIQSLSDSIQAQKNTTDLPVPDVQGYYRRAGGGGAVYQALSDGTLKWLDRAQYEAAGSPTYRDVATSDPLWNRQVTGTDAPAQFR